MSQTKKPKVSICIPNYNDSETLPKAIESAINQTYTDTRIIVLDDGSEDNSLDIINKYTKKDPRIQVYTHDKNMGVPNTINNLLDLVDTEYITFFYSDCIYSEFFLEIGMKVFSIYPDIALFSTPSTTNYNHFISNKDTLGKYIGIVYLSPQKYRKMLYHGTSPTFLSSIFKKDIFDKYGYFSECRRRLNESKFFYWISDDSSIALHTDRSLCYKKLHDGFELIHRGMIKKLNPDIIRQSKEYIEELMNEKDLLIYTSKNIPHDDLLHHCIAYHYYLISKEYLIIGDKSNANLYISLFINEMSKIKKLPDTFYAKKYLEFIENVASKTPQLV